MEQPSNRCNTEEDAQYNEFEHYCVTGCTLRAIMTKEKYQLDVNRCENSAFILCCRYGYLEIAKWIHSLDASKFKDDDYCIAYQYAIVNGHVPVSNWICSLVNDNYELMSRMIFTDKDFIAMYDDWLYHQQYCRFCN